MAEEPTRQSELEFLETLYSDPLSPSAAKAGRNLVISALLLLAVSRFGASVQSTPLFPISFANRPEALPTVLTILLVVLALNFVSKVIPDLLRYREVDVRIVRFINSEKIANAKAAAQEVDDTVYREPEYDGDPDPEEWWKDYGEVKSAADAAISAAEKRLGHRELPRWVRLGRTVGEVGVPIALAAVAVWEARLTFHW